MKNIIFTYYQKEKEFREVGNEHLVDVSIDNLTSTQYITTNLPENFIMNYYIPKWGRKVGEEIIDKDHFKMIYNKYHPISSDRKGFREIKLKTNGDMIVRFEMRKKR